MQLAFAGSSAMRQLLERAARFSQWPVEVLIQGETGTGKSWLARWIHQCSPRSRQPFEYFSLADPELSLLGSDLFGHYAGSFTDAKTRRQGLFARANHGTVFFDEVGKCPIAVQHKLLHILDEQTFLPLGADRPVSVDVRMLFAASEPLAELVNRGVLAADFLPRLGPVVLTIPPLRERRADILPLARAFVAAYCARAPNRESMRVPALSERLCEALVEYRWPWNVRELKHLMQTLVILGNGDRLLDTSLLEGELERYRLAPRDRQARQAERREVAMRALTRAGGVKVRAAAMLGWSVSTLGRVLRKASA